MSDADWRVVDRALRRLNELADRAGSPGAYNDLVALLEADPDRFVDAIAIDTEWHTDGRMWTAANSARTAQWGYVALYRLAAALRELGVRGNQLDGNFELLKKWTRTAPPDPFWNT